MAKFSTVMDTATCTKSSWTNRQKAMFHAHNPNGMVSALRSLCEQIDQIVGDGPVPYCCYDSDYEMMLYRLTPHKTVKRGDLNIALWGLERRIKEAREFIAAHQIAA